MLNFYWLRWSSLMKTQRTRRPWSLDWSISTTKSSTSVLEGKSLWSVVDCLTWRNKFDWTGPEPKKKRKFTTCWKFSLGSTLLMIMKNLCRLSSRRGRSGRGSKNWRSSRRKGSGHWPRSRRIWRVRRERKRSWERKTMMVSAMKRYFTLLFRARPEEWGRIRAIPRRGRHGLCSCQGKKKIFVANSVCLSLNIPWSSKELSVKAWDWVLFLRTSCSKCLGWTLYWYSLYSTTWSMRRKSSCRRWRPDRL